MGERLDHFDIDWTLERQREQADEAWPDNPPCIYGHFDCSLDGNEGGPCSDENREEPEKECE